MVSWGAGRANRRSDGVTGNQAPLIASHPALSNLLVAGGGSYTRAKDLPTNGAYVANLLNGGEVPSRFSWDDLASTGQDHPHLVPKTDFAFLEAEARKDLGPAFRRAGVKPGVLAIVKVFSGSTGFSNFL